MGSVADAKELKAQKDADDAQAATDAENARKAGMYAQQAATAAANALSSANAARTLAMSVSSDRSSDLADAKEDETAAQAQATAAATASASAAAISAEGNPAVAAAQTAAATSATAAATSANMATGAVIALQGYVDSDAIVADSDAVSAADKHVEMLRGIVDWIRGAEEDDVTNAKANANAAADLAPRLAENALAEGGHNSEITVGRVAQMSDLTDANSALKATVDAVAAAANEDYDSAVPLFEDGMMNAAGSMVTTSSDLATGKIIMSGDNGRNTDAFMVDGAKLESSETISNRDDTDYIGDLRIVSTAGRVPATGDQTHYTTEVIQYDNWNVKKPYELVTFGSWATDSSDGEGFAIGGLNKTTDITSSRTDNNAFDGGVFVFADRSNLAMVGHSQAAEAEYNGSHASVILANNTAKNGRTVSGDATITVDFDEKDVDVVLRERTDASSFTNFYTIENLTLTNGNSLGVDKDTAVSGLSDYTSLVADVNFGADGAIFAPTASGGIFGTGSEEIAGTIKIVDNHATEANRQDFEVLTAFGGRHQSHQK